METNQAIIHFLTAASVFSRTILIIVIKWKYRYVLCHWVPYLDLSTNITRSSVNRCNRVTAIEMKMEREPYGLRRWFYLYGNYTRNAFYNTCILRDWFSRFPKRLKPRKPRCPARMCPARMYSSRRKLRFHGIIQRLDLLLDIATRGLIPESIENVDARVESERASYTAKRSWALSRALSNRSVDEPKVLLSRKGHREYASAPSSRFTFSSLVHLLLLHGIRRSQVFEPAICTAWPPCRFQSPPDRRQVQRLSLYTGFFFTAVYIHTIGKSPLGPDKIYRLLSYGGQ